MLPASACVVHEHVTALQAGLFKEQGPASPGNARDLVERCGAPCQGCSGKGLLATAGSTHEFMDRSRASMREYSRQRSASESCRTCASVRHVAARLSACSAGHLSTNVTRVGKRYGPERSWLERSTCRMWGAFRHARSRACSPRGFSVPGCSRATEDCMRRHTIEDCVR